MEKTGLTDREILLSFIGSLTLCDHMGDVSNDVDEVLKLVGEQELRDAAGEGDDFSELAKALHKRGVKTLYGTDLSSEDEP